jgi:hypothetical protein
MIEIERRASSLRCSPILARVMDNLRLESEIWGKDGGISLSNWLCHRLRPNPAARSGYGRGIKWVR